MKKIAFLGPNLESPGGVNVAINHLSKFFKNQGFEVHFFPVGQTKVKENEFIHPINTNKKAEQLNIFREEIKFFEFDLIIANNLRTHFLLSSLNVKNDLYVFHQGAVIQKKGIFTGFKQKLKFKKIYENKRIIFLNKCFKKEFLQKFKLNIKSYIIPNSFDVEEIKKKADEFEIKGNYILGIGRLTKSKNFECLLKAYAKRNFSEKLWFLGDGEAREKLQKLAKNLRIEQKVKFLGWQNNPFPFIKNAKVVVHPSKFEVLPTILIESLILNTPVVATDIKCGPNEILINNLKQFLVPLGKVDVLSGKIEEALKNYPKIKVEYIEKYKFENVGRQYLQFLQ